MSLHAFLTFYSWLGLSALIVLMALIARFYERLSGERTYYRWFALPVLTLTGAALQQARLDQITGDPVIDALGLTGGVSLGIVCLHVYRRMTSGR